MYTEFLSFLSPKAFKRKDKGGIAIVKMVDCPNLEDETVFYLQLLLTPLDQVNFAGI